MLSQSGDGFKVAQIRLSPARLSHCMRWHGAAVRANEIAIDYARRHDAFGKSPVDHEGVGFKLAYSLIGLKQAELMIDWCTAALDTGSLGKVDPSMTKVATGPVLRRRSLRPGEGRTGTTRDTIVEQVFRETRAFYTYDGLTEVHKWSLTKKIKRDPRRQRLSELPAAAKRHALRQSW